MLIVHDSNPHVEFITLFLIKRNRRQIEQPWKITSHPSATASSSLCTSYCSQSLAIPRPYLVSCHRSLVRAVCIMVTGVVEADNIVELVGVVLVGHVV